MLSEAKKHGARVALYGRKINNSEHQLTFVKYLRAVADEEIAPDDAVRAYHGDLGKLGIRPYRSLDEDLKLTYTASSYAGTSTARPVSVSAPRPTSAASPRPPASAPDEPDFSKMTPAEKARWNIERWKRILG
jgi:hypothetical protein